LLGSRPCEQQRYNQPLLGKSAAPGQGLPLEAECWVPVKGTPGVVQSLLALNLQPGDLVEKKDAVRARRYGTREPYKQSKILGKDRHGTDVARVAAMYSMPRAVPSPPLPSPLLPAAIVHLYSFPGLAYGWKGLSIRHHNIKRILHSSLVSTTLQSIISQNLIRHMRSDEGCHAGGLTVIIGTDSMHSGAKKGHRPLFRTD
jgi:hypothetical protein